MTEYVECLDALKELALLDTGEEEYTDNISRIRATIAISNIPAADVISKADMITLLKKTEKDITKSITRDSTAWMFTNAIFGIIKCKVNKMGEKIE